MLFLSPGGMGQAESSMDSDLGHGQTPGVLNSLTHLPSYLLFTLFFLPVGS